MPWAGVNRCSPCGEPPKHPPQRLLHLRPAWPQLWTSGLVPPALKMLLDCLQPPPFPLLLKLLMSCLRHLQPVRCQPC